MTTLTIEGHKYLVTTKFQHPGEGIRDVYIRDYDGNDVTYQFDIHHFTNEPWEILEKARKNGEYQGVKYLGKVKTQERKTT